jgi:hypothetical protein
VEDYRDMSDEDSKPDGDHPREDDRGETVDDSAAPDPEQGVTAEDDPQAD